MYCRSMLMLSRSLHQARLERLRARKRVLEAQSTARAGGRAPPVGSNSIGLSGTNVHGERCWSAAGRSSPSPSTSPVTAQQFSPVTTGGPHLASSGSAQTLAKKAQSLGQVLPRGLSASSPRRSQGSAGVAGLSQTLSGPAGAGGGRRVTFDRSVKLGPITAGGAPAVTAVVPGPPLRPVGLRAGKPQASRFRAAAGAGGSSLSFG
jgi:hypothetical protein